MRAYLTPLGQVDDTMRRIDLDEGNRVGVYRDGQTVLAESPDETYELGVRDVTVSRKKGGRAPVEFTAVRDGVEIHAHPEATNDVTVRTGTRELSVGPGETERVTDSCRVQIGYNAAVRLTVEDTGRSSTGDTLSAEEAEKLRQQAERQSGATSGEGPSRAAYARVVADNLRAKRRRSPNDCLQVATEVKNFVHENPIEASGYDDTCDAVDGLVEKLDSMVSNTALRQDELDQENRERVERVASQVESLYSRAG